MALRRRCLVEGCTCAGYAFEIDTYEGSDEEIIETGRDELKPFCSICGHSEQEHELMSDR